MTQIPTMVRISTFPRDLVREMDRLVGRHRRKEFLNASVREKLERVRLAGEVAV